MLTAPFGDAIEGLCVNVLDDEMRVGSALGVGGEAQVLAVLDADGVRWYALKWFKKPSATPEKAATISELLRRGPPSSSFLWPVAFIADPTGSGRFGYVMDIRGSEYIELKDVVHGVRHVEHDQIVRACFEVARQLRALHLSGLCYRDLNLRNIFLDPATGRVLICDTDNIGVEGQSTALVRGVAKYMAPEVARRDAWPSLLTDRYTLAVILFQALMLHHPLVGRRTDAETIESAEIVERHFGHDPLFVFDPDDDRNRLDPDRFEWHVHPQQFWDVYPQFLRELFVRSFTEGLWDPERRVTDTEWCDAMLRLMAARSSCEDCGFFAFNDHQDSGVVCARCGSDIRDDRIELRTANGTLTHSLVLSDRTRVSSHHLWLDYHLDRVILQAVEQRSVLALQNVSDASVTVVGRRGGKRHLPPGQLVPVERLRSVAVTGGPHETTATADIIWDRGASDT